jgi:hypothetical protein
MPGSEPRTKIMTRLSLPSLLLLAACSADDRATTVEPATTGPQHDCEGTETAPSLLAVAHGRANNCEKDLFLRVIMERGRRVGPWIEEIWVAPATEDLQVDLDQASLVHSSGAVPEVILHEGRYWLFYGDGDLGRAFELASVGSDRFLTRGLPGFGALGLLVSDDGVSFEPVPEFAIDDLVVGMVVDPDLIQLPDGRFRLYYVGLPVELLTDADAWNDDAQHDVYYAESSDLIHWKQIGIAVHGPIADPSVYCITAERCRMFSTGLDHSHSTDGGRSFVFDGETRISAFAPEFVVTGGALHQVYNAMEHGGPLHSRRTTDDGKGWSEAREIVSAYQAEAPSFARAPSGEGWLMYYHYYMAEYRDIYPARPDAMMEPGTPTTEAPQP